MVERPGEVLIEHTVARLSGRAVELEEFRPVPTVTGDGWPEEKGCWQVSAKPWLAHRADSESREPYRPLPVEFERSPVAGERYLLLQKRQTPGHGLRFCRVLKAFLRANTDRPGHGRAAEKNGKSLAGGGNYFEWRPIPEQA